MTTTPRWLREHRRASHAAAAELLADEVAWRVAEKKKDALFKRIDWDNFGSPIPDEEWEPFIAAIEEAKGRPLFG